MICLTLPTPVSANRYWRSFVPRGKSRAIVVVSDEAKAYREEVAWRARLAGVTPLQGRVVLELRLYPQRPQDWAKRAQRDPDNWADTVQRMDVGNCEKVVGDALNGIAYHDDKQVKRMVKEWFDPDELGARLEVDISLWTPPVVIAPQLFEEAAA